ncbi:hypothetical protein [Streptomyces sp. NPDC050485]|uniref:hypothetical protein n=1 Tax=Streptomyces sp. NPDC050485 TaxID=3365617 RepID=UPI0037A44D8E
MADSIRDQFTHDQDGRFDEFLCRPPAVQRLPGEGSRLPGRRQDGLQFDGGGGDFGISARNIALDDSIHGVFRSFRRVWIAPWGLP